jgi:2-polyprenyl-6-methoxyphenol hydroxylase-like FAD-dependent oxidoreductase
MGPIGHACIVGGGIGGLAAAIALRQAGYEVALFEKAATFAPLGAALSLWPNAMSALRFLGVAEPIERQAAPVVSVGVKSKSGRTILASTATGRGSDGIPTAFLPTRALLQAALLGAIDTRCLVMNCAIASVSEDEERVRLRTARGEVHHADLVVLADGIWSALAQTIAPGAPRHAGYGGALAITGSCAGNLDGVLTEFWAAGERFGFGEIGGARRYWYYLCNESAPHQAGELTLEQIRRRMAGWPGGIAETLAATAVDALIPFSVHARRAPRWLGLGRIICLGDAAHAMEPNLGQGACQAIEDALALGRSAMRHPPVSILAAYERARLRRIRSIVNEARRGGRMTHAYPAFVARSAQALFSLTPRPLSEHLLRRVWRLPDY